MPWKVIKAKSGGYYTVKVGTGEMKKQRMKIGKLNIAMGKECGSRGIAAWFTWWSNPKELIFLFHRFYLEFYFKK